MFFKLFEQNLRVHYYIARYIIYKAKTIKMLVLTGEINVSRVSPQNRGQVTVSLPIEDAGGKEMILEAELLCLKKKKNASSGTRGVTCLTVQCVRCL